MAADDVTGVGAEQLGRQLIAWMRGTGTDDATQALRFGAEGVDDETVWTAVVTAARLAADESERWMLADGVVAESVWSRPALAERWERERRNDPSIRAVDSAADDGP